MAQLNADAEVVKRNLDAIAGKLATACDRSGRNPAAVTICAATKYVDVEGMTALRDAGVRVAAENRLQDMVAKQERFADDFDWHFIGRIQSRKIPQIASRVSAIHSLASDSARDRLNNLTGELPRVLVQVNIAGEQSKEGVGPAELEGFLGECRFEVCGLMTMPPLAADPEDARPHFRLLAQLARDHGLSELSMGTSQDFIVAVEEGATMIRVGSVLFDA